ncbi:hypothetical protein DSECCO2_572230 [anaerobic digester metagenome]
MDTTRAITSSSPIRTPPAASMKVSMSALRGSLFFLVPLAKNGCPILSKAMACNIRGAPNILPKAEERVAPHMPATTKAGTSEILYSISLSLANILASTVYA